MVPSRNCTTHLWAAKPQGLLGRRGLCLVLDWRRAKPLMLPQVHLIQSAAPFGGHLAKPLKTRMLRHLDSFPLRCHARWYHVPECFQRG